MTDNTNLVVETNDLGKRYGERIVAVDGLDLTVRRGEVYGFLGPNGAGKTTTLRMLLGLIRPTTGSALVLGAAPGTPDSLRRLGALIESPTFYPYLSGRDNLRVLARYAGVPETRIAPVLEEVDLASRAGDRFGTYSLGMKQRLGIAAVLLKDPELLVFDEPTNGMDPAGMAEMRPFIRSLGRGNRTVLLSSHLMSEVEQVCDRVGVISRGRLVGEGTVDELRGREGLWLRADPTEEAERVLRSLQGVEEVAREDDGLRIAAEPAAAATINRALVEAGIAVSELRPEARHWRRSFSSSPKKRRQHDQARHRRAADVAQARQHVDPARDLGRARAHVRLRRPLHPVHERSPARTCRPAPGEPGRDAPGRLPVLRRGAGPHARRPHRRQRVRLGDAEDPLHARARPAAGLRRQADRSGRDPARLRARRLPAGCAGELGDRRERGGGHHLAERVAPHPGHRRRLARVRRLGGARDPSRRGHARHRPSRPASASSMRSSSRAC